MNWVKQLFSQCRLYSDLPQEIREHLAEKIDEVVANGISREEATHAARRDWMRACCALCRFATRFNFTF